MRRSLAIWSYALKVEKECPVTGTTIGSLRYHRQELFAPIGKVGQVRLRAGRVLIVGVGALGGSIAAQLARAGVGLLRLVDDDVVSFSNLHRQFLFTEQDAATATPKVVAAKHSLQSANQDVVVESHFVRLTEQNGPQLCQGMDVILDGSDNFPCRFLLNRLAVSANIPFVTGGVRGMTGQCWTIRPRITPCFSCLFAENFSEQSEQSEQSVETEPFVGGVVSPIVQVISAIQATAAIQLLTGHSEEMPSVITDVDLWTLRFRQISLGQPVVECPVCG